MAKLTEAQLRIALQGIAALGPDEKLSTTQGAAAFALIRKGWLKSHGCSDGNYVEVTKAGRTALAESENIDV